MIAPRNPDPRKSSRLPGYPAPVPAPRSISAFLARTCALAAALLCATPAVADSETGLIIGEFTVARVVDGDTVRVDGLDASLRLIGIDTEEIPHNAKERRALEQATSFDAYVKAQRGASKRPVKMATPMGEAAKTFAERYFAKGVKVRLEHDDADQSRDRYGRYLAYVFVEKDGQWVDYNLEAVRAGMSPYFTKYGYSRRFDAEFRAAEQEAKAAHRGIWAADTQHYPDYDERAAWWNARADFVARFEQDEVGHEELIDLTDDDAGDRLARAKGTTVTVLGTIGKIYPGRTTRVLLSRRRGEDFPIIFFDKRVLAASGMRESEGEFVRVTGEVSEYTSGHRTQLEIVVRRADQVERSAVPSASGDASAVPDDDDDGETVGD
jgi:endonuclease YncB( thermonuclease family)